MSTIGREPATGLPPLVEGERLDRATFHARYEAMPEETRAELIDGLVEMMSPIRKEHSFIGAAVISWLYVYATGVEGLESTDPTTLLLDERNEFQPDASLLVLPEYSGQCRFEEGYIAGAPELIVEVSHSTRGKDLGRKFREYERTGVREYVVFARGPEQVYWFVRREDRLVPLEPGADGWFRSEAFPGLWLDPVALFAGDKRALAAASAQGKATPEHAAFVAQMEARRPD